MCSNSQRITHGCAHSPDPFLWCSSLVSEVHTRGVSARHGRQYLGTKTVRPQNSKLRSKTQIVNVGQKAATLKQNWAGHISGISSELWAKVTEDRIPHDASWRYGRSIRRGRDELALRARSSYKILACSDDKSRCVEEGHRSHVVS